MAAFTQPDFDLRASGQLRKKFRSSFQKHFRGIAGIDMAKQFNGCLMFPFNRSFVGNVDHGYNVVFCSGHGFHISQDVLCG
jgi:hypothetical protein